MDLWDWCGDDFQLPRLLVEDVNLLAKDDDRKTSYSMVANSVHCSQTRKDRIKEISSLGTSLGMLNER